MHRLSNASVAALPHAVARPRYDRHAVTPGIIHLGIGAFHRAHQAVYLDDCLAAGELTWGIRAASLRSADTRDKLSPQDGMYTVATRDSENETLRVVGSISDVLVAREDPSVLLQALVDPRIRIVTLTVTEKAYGVDLGTQSLRIDDIDVAHDIEVSDRPRSAIGFLVEAIAQRRMARIPPFTVLSCDNQPSNGRTVRLALRLMAERQGRDLGSFIADELACPSCMVDRIVPATTADDCAHVSRSLGLQDEWPVMAEPFSQWVIEDRFTGGRPALESCGVQFVDDVSRHERMKLRLLNGAHTSLAAIGLLVGKVTVADAMDDVDIRQFIRAYWVEAMGSLDLPPAEMTSYTDKLLLRFRNRALRHRLDQIATDGSQKVPQRLLQSLNQLGALGKPRGTLIYAVAAWMLSCDGVSESGETFAVNDKVFASRFTGNRRHMPAQVLTDTFLASGETFGQEFTTDATGIRAALATAVEQIKTHGVIGAMQRRSATH